MGENHKITKVGDKWRVEFLRRLFTREFNTEGEMKTVIEADTILAEAENVLLYSPQEIDTDRRSELAAKLRDAAESLEKILIEGFTIRHFKYLANDLEGKE